MILKKLASSARATLFLAAACATSSESPEVQRTAQELFDAAVVAQQQGEEGWLDLFERAAAEGSTSAFKRLAEIYLHGQGVEVDHAKAVHWLERTAEIGDLESRYNLGVMYYYGRGTPKNLAGAAECWRIAGERGYAAAQTNLGAIYILGDGVKADASEAARWFRRAADSGDSLGQIKFALVLMDGLGVEQDKVGAVRWMRAAAQNGSASAQEEMAVWSEHGRGMDADLVEAAVWAFRAKQQGSAKGTRLFTAIDERLREALSRNEAIGYRYLGVLNSEGLGVPVDQETAFRMFFLASKFDVKAMLEVARRRAAGLGVEEDDVLAVQDCQRAAELGNDVAEFEYGLLIDHRDTPESHAEAVGWFERAAAKGHAEARAMLALEALRIRALAGDREAALELGRAFHMGDVVRSDYPSAVHWFRSLGEDDLDALYELGNKFLSGGTRTDLLGSQRYSGDYEESQRCTKKAADRGHTEARVAYSIGLAATADDAQELELAAHYADLAAADGNLRARGFLENLIAERNQKELARQQEAVAREHNRIADQRYRAEMESRRQILERYVPATQSTVVRDSPCGFCNGQGQVLATRGYYLNGNYWPDTTRTCLDCNGTGLLFH